MGKRENFAFKAAEQAMQSCGLSYDRGTTTGDQLLLSGFFRTASGRQIAGPRLTVANMRGKPERLCLSASLISSFEGLLSALWEHYSGHLPLWLAPEQVRILSMGAKARCSADSLYASLLSIGVRATHDQQDSQLKERIFRAEEQRVPLIAIMGEREVREKMVSIRTKGVTKSMAPSEFVEEVKQALESYGVMEASC